MSETRKQRIKTIRKRVAAGALAIFGLAFGLIAETGSMGASASSGTSQAASSRNAASSSPAASSERSPASRSAAPPVTTQQS